MTRQALTQDRCPQCRAAMTNALTQALHIVDEVAAECGLPIKDVYSKSRRAHLVAARGCAIRRIREETTLKLAAIGYLFGLDHSTVIHHLSKNGAKEAAAAERGARERPSRKGTA